MRELDVSTATRVGTVRLPTHRGYVGTIHIFFELYFTIDFGLCDRAFRGVSLWCGNVIERAARSAGRQGWFMKWGKCSRLVCTDRTRCARYGSESRGGIRTRIRHVLSPKRRKEPLKLLQLSFIVWSCEARYLDPNLRYGRRDLHASWSLLG